MAYVAGGDRSPEALANLCSTLARGIDAALANNHVPSGVSCLPSLVKQVYQHRNDTSLQSAVTLLMLSIKNACGNGWFHGADADELLQLANELLRSFCMNMSITTVVTNEVDTISKIIPRFLPQLKLDHVIVSFEAKPGYDILMADFLIRKSMPPEDAVRLFIARSDDLETSSCLISPSSVSFLVNGEGVAGRTNVSMDHGPQFPTDVTAMLKNGTNIIQAVGYFDCNYVIAVTSMSKITSPSPIPEDFDQPVATEPVPDSEIIEGVSRISLNCPISFKRIKTPVKGRFCKHHQCFDYGNFLEMNSKKPYWRCPCCNHPISFMDLRTDQSMVKILQDVTVDVTDVVIHPNGSWMVAIERNGSADQLYDGKSAKTLENKISGEPINVINFVDNVVDITMGRDDGCSKFTLEREDRNLPQKFMCVPEYCAEQAITHCEIGITGVTNQLGDDIWLTNQSLAAALSPSFVSAAMTDAHRVETLASLVGNIILNPVFTDAASPVLGLEPTDSLAVNQASTYPSVSEIGGSTIPTSSASGSARAVPSTSSFPGEFNIVSTDIGRLMVSGTSDLVAPLAQLHAITQNPDSSRGLISAPNGSPQLQTSKPAGRSVHPNHHRVGYPGDPLLLPSEHQGSYQKLLNLGRQKSMSKHALQNPRRHYIPLETRSLAYQQHQRLAAQRIEQLATLRSAQQSEPAARSSLEVAADTTRLTSPVGAQLHDMAGEPPAVPGADGLQGLQPAHAWQPTGRMRGSLTGAAYSSALDRYMAPSSY